MVAVDNETSSVLCLHVPVQEINDAGLEPGLGPDQIRKEELTR
jgi:hypothetical protein